MRKTHIAGVAMTALAFALAFASPASAQRIGDKAGVNFADPSDAHVEGPKTISGKTSFVSPLPFFKDLKPWDSAYKAPVNKADGHADLEGVWSSASLTTMTRGKGPRSGANIKTLEIPADKINDYVGQTDYNQNRLDSQKRTDPKAGVFTDKNTDAGYNAFWIDPGSEFIKVNGQWRSSFITVPENGQIPYNKGGDRAVGARMNDVATVRNTGPELRAYGERCLISFGNQGGPPLTNAMYNNNIQIVQTADHVMLDIEMDHDARIIRIKKPGEDVKPRPGVVAPWFGDEIGWWEGDTLVVETRHLHPLQARGRIPLSEKGVVRERFKRVSPVEIYYAFEVDDPANYSQVWKGEMTLRKSNENVYEYACHEGNYAMPGILRGMAAGLDTAVDKDGE
jgi:hypothetical protein